jgi:hypothetical protein
LPPYRKNDCFSSTNIFTVMTEIAEIHDTKIVYTLMYCSIGSIGEDTDKELQLIDVCPKYWDGEIIASEKIPNGYFCCLTALDEDTLNERKKDIINIYIDNLELSVIRDFIHQKYGIVRAFIVYKYIMDLVLEEKGIEDMHDIDTDVDEAFYRRLAKEIMIEEDYFRIGAKKTSE